MITEYIICATLVACGKAWMSPAIESLAVVQMKLDKERGAEDIANFNMTMQFLGSIL